MEGSITQGSQTRQKPFSKDVRVKLYPNGECAIYLQRKFTPKPVKAPFRFKPGWLFLWMNRVAHSYLGMPVAWLCAMGSSQVRNFDRNSELNAQRQSSDFKEPVVYGRRGITRFGARRVRCAAHLLQREAGKYRVVMSTVTVPPLPKEDMSSIHESWNHVVDTYRRKISRALRDKNLTGEMVSVTEIQEKRYEKTGIPVLHIHAVFVGKTTGGQWAVSTEDHDDMWRSTLSVALGKDVGEVGSACRLERVKHSTEGYIGKYLTKGTKAVKAMVDGGFQGWIPKQWWSCSRSLSSRVDKETRDISDLAEWLNAVAEVEGACVWKFFQDVYLEVEGGHKIRIARYGRLHHRVTAEIQAAHPLREMSDIAY